MKTHWASTQMNGSRCFGEAIVEWSFFVQILGSWIYNRDSNLQFVDSKVSETGFHVGLSLKWASFPTKKPLKRYLNNLTSLVGCSGIHAAHARCFDEQRDAWLRGGSSQELTYATLKRAFKKGVILVSRSCKWLGTPPVCKPWNSAHLEREQAYLPWLLLTTY